jgi:hypothetical protein
MLLLLIVPVVFGVAAVLVLADAFVVVCEYRLLCVSLKQAMPCRWMVEYRSMVVLLFTFSRP